MPPRHQNGARPVATGKRGYRASGILSANNAPHLFEKDSTQTEERPSVNLVLGFHKRLVGANGFEPSTSWSRTRRASQAALRPDATDDLGRNVRPKGDHQINIALRLRATASQFSNNHASSPEPKECVIFSLYLETRSLQNMLWVQNKTAGKFEPPGGN
jgi:hypothetical protein